MNVLYFHQHFSTPDGGTGTRSYEMASALARAGHGVHVVCGGAARGNTGLDGPFRHGRRSGTVDGFRVTELQVEYSNRQSFPRRTLAFVAYAWRAMLIAIREDCDLVFATSTPLTAALPGIAARLVRGRRFVFEVRDLWPDVPRDMGVIRNRFALGAMTVLERIAYRCANGCIGLSPGMVEAIERRSPAGLPVVLVPNGCDLDMFSPTVAVAPSGDGEELLDEALTRSGIGSDHVVAMYTGAHGHANGLDASLDAAEELRRRGREDIRLVFVGDGARKAALVERCETAGLSNCAFVDSVPKRVLVRLLARADIGLMTLVNVPAFHYGTSPNKFFDYISAGKPVVVNHPGWLADMIAENGLGEVAEPGDPLSLADALERLADDPDARRQAASAARSLAEREFDRRSLAMSFVAFLERIGRAEDAVTASGAGR